MGVLLAVRLIRITNTGKQKMKSQFKTKQEMRSEKAPTPDTIESLCEYVASLVDRQHDYVTCVYAMSLAATAALNHVAHKLRVSGFQASCADLDIVRRNRGIEGPFILLNGEDMLYPQYDLTKKLHEAMEGWAGWAAEQAAKKIAENEKERVHPDVWAHWVALAVNK
jgi:hypothetical protein